MIKQKHCIITTGYPNNIPMRWEGRDFIKVRYQRDLSKEEFIYQAFYRYTKTSFQKSNGVWFPTDGIVLKIERFPIGSIEEWPDGLSQEFKRIHCNTSLSKFEIASVADYIDTKSTSFVSLTQEHKNAPVDILKRLGTSELVYISFLLSSKFNQDRVFSAKKDTPGSIYLEKRPNENIFEGLNDGSNIPTGIETEAYLINQFIGDYLSFNHVDIQKYVDLRKGKGGYGPFDLRDFENIDKYIIYNSLENHPLSLYTQVAINYVNLYVKSVVPQLKALSKSYEKRKVEERIIVRDELNRYNSEVPRMRYIQQLDDTLRKRITERTFPRVPDEITNEILNFLPKNVSRAFLSTSTDMKYTKNMYQYLNLTRKSSRRFIADENFRVKVLSTIINPNKQLSLHLDYMMINDVSMLGNVHTLKLWHCSEITDVSMLGNVHTLILFHCSKITDVAMLGNVHNLNLRKCNGITKVSMLGNVHNLNLSECNGITDVSMLGNVHTLNLSKCNGITDVSMLGNVHTLNLSGCSGITDVSMLRNVHTLTLNLSQCDGIKDETMLENVVIVE